MSYDQFLKSKPYNELIRYLANAGLGLDDAALSALKSDYYNWFIQGREEDPERPLELFFNEYYFLLEHIPHLLTELEELQTGANSMYTVSFSDAQRQLNQIIDLTAEFKAKIVSNVIFDLYNYERVKILAHLNSIDELLKDGLRSPDNYIPDITTHLESIEEEILDTYQSIFNSSIFNSINREGELVEANSEGVLNHALIKLLEKDGNEQLP